MQLKFTTAVLLGFVLIAASACGGSGSSMTSMTSTEPDTPMMYEVELPAGHGLTAGTIAVPADGRELASGTTISCDSEDGCTLTITQLPVTGELEATSTGGQVTVTVDVAATTPEPVEPAEPDPEPADTDAARQAEIDAANQRAAEAEAARQAAEAEAEKAQQQLTEAEQAELRARAESFGAQLNAPEPGTAIVSWTRGNRLTFKPEGTLDPGSAAPSVPGGWRSASFTGHAGTANALIDETVYLYTNIQAPSSRNFWKVHNVEVAAQSAADLTTDTANNDPTPTGAARVVRVGNTLDYADSATYNIAVSGTYDGVSGTYTCTTGCTIADGPDDDSDITAADFNADDWVLLSGGERTFVTGSWSFKPGSITALVKAEDQADQDDAYLYFGIWSSIPDSITGTYNFRYIRGGTIDSGFATRFATLTGPATFRGGAVGRYVTQGQVGGQNAKIGTFTATATLNADFTANTLSGSITDFREDGNALAGWRVTLGKAGDVGDAASIVDAAVATQENGTVANIGGLSVGGSWGANFYGSANEELADRDKYPASRYPPVDLAGVAGWFDATGPGTGTDPNDVALAGAFAATPSN
ncbi:MAG: transferrin-binding protein-like solute binding protein [Chloroflexi bacterium]|nr:transferrin-binding protein-like solute binding protein [Chloroflexota bacterium]